MSKHHFIFAYGQQGDALVVNISACMEDGFILVPMPAACYSLFLPRKKRCADAHGDFIHP